MLPLHVWTQCAGPQDEKRYYQLEGNEIAIRVMQKAQGIDSS